MKLNYPYWQNELSKEAALAWLAEYDTQLSDQEEDAQVTTQMRQSYPDYIFWRWHIYQNGNCLGYVPESVVEQLLSEGLLDKCGEHWYRLKEKDCRA